MGMTRKSNKLEEQLLATRKPDLACGALIASGTYGEKALKEYLNKIEALCQLFKKSVFVTNGIIHPHSIRQAHDMLNPLRQGRGDINTATALSNWLWSTKPKRYESQGNFRLTNVIDNQLDPSVERIGNCLGLTLLFNTLAYKIGLKAQAIHIEDTGDGPHVLSMLFFGHKKIDVENTLPTGFEYQGHLRNPRRELWGNRELIADIYLSIGNESFEHNKPEEAIANYTKAITLNHKYTKAYLNRGIALATLGQDKAATMDFNKHSGSYKY